MKYFIRNLGPRLKSLVGKFPILSLTGPRQSGKTTLLKNEFPEFKYFNLERPDYRELISSDYIGFLRNNGPGTIFDEAQNLPDLFCYLQVISDERGTNGQYILSGSQSFLLNEKISQSLAGRVAISHLLPLTIDEIPVAHRKVYSEYLLYGFYPRVYQSDIKPDDFYPSYIQTYIERDLRNLRSISDLNTFTRFFGLCAGRTGQILNISSLANDSGISVNTAKAWLSLLEASFIIFLLQPYHRNFNKRLIKSPKIFFWDSGVAASLLRITDPIAARNHYLYGSLFENMVISEILKKYYHSGKQPPVYYWRESSGTEIDCLIETGSNSLSAVEIKGGETFSGDYIKNLNSFEGWTEGFNVKKYLVLPAKNISGYKDVRILDINELDELII